MPDVTHLLETTATSAGDRHAAMDLLPLVYGELRKLAAVRIAAEAPGQTLQPTALVHQAYLRLVGSTDEPRWAGQGHFFAAAAEAMRRILVESARRKASHKHGGDRHRVDLDGSLLAPPDTREDLVALDEALNKLAATEPQAAELVQLRYFAALPLPEIAPILGISPRTCDRLWAFARAWLHQELENNKS
jgi:RNA polymerase sigma factor (TIGR02999 family)